MAGDATDGILRMFRVNCIHVLRAARVAGQAAVVDFQARSVLESKKFGDIAAAGNVGRSGSMAGFTPLVRRAASCVQRRLPVRCFFPATIDIFVASLTNIGAQILRLRGRLCRSRCRRGWLGSGFRCGAELGRWGAWACENKDKNSKNRRAENANSHRRSPVARLHLMNQPSLINGVIGERHRPCILFPIVSQSNYWRFGSCSRQ